MLRKLNLYGKKRNIEHFFNALFVSIKYGFPSKKLKVISVTGTDGKTTTCYLIYEVLKAAGKNPGMITTVETRLGKKRIETGLHTTTPGSLKLNRLIKQMIKEGCNYLVLETTSHAIDQHRVFGIKSEVGVITNVTKEHLDYHKTFKRYIKKKAKILKKSKHQIINRGDSSYELLKKYTRNPTTYGINCNADINKSHLYGIDLKLQGKYNQENALAAIATAKTLGIEEKSIKNGIERVKSISGRFNIIQETPFKIIVDFAHTPNSMEKVLKEVNDNRGGRTIIVFGCAGLRDKSKRSTMGEISGKLADKIIVTMEDPRTEDLNKINGHIVEGLKRVGRKLKQDYFVIKDRKRAIDFAINKLAKKGDLVLITGKGHEKSMAIGDKEIPWNDAEVAKKACASQQTPDLTNSTNLHNRHHSQVPKFPPQPSPDC
jgi:UDP-N-acetylmuramoyl-L-alanyl-D-glutamate--2,6-diaminopimelate ligase